MPRNGWTQEESRPHKLLLPNFPLAVPIHQHLEKWDHQFVNSENLTNHHQGFRTNYYKRINLRFLLKTNGRYYFTRIIPEISLAWWQEERIEALWPAHNTYWEYNAQTVHTVTYSSDWNLVSLAVNAGVNWDSK